MTAVSAAVEKFSQAPAKARPFSLPVEVGLKCCTHELNIFAARMEKLILGVIKETPVAASSTCSGFHDANGFVQNCS